MGNGEGVASGEEGVVGRRSRCFGDRRKGIGDGGSVVVKGREWRRKEER